MSGDAKKVRGEKEKEVASQRGTDTSGQEHPGLAVTFSFALPATCLLYQPLEGGLGKPKRGESALTSPIRCRRPPRRPSGTMVSERLSQQKERKSRDEKKRGEGRVFDKIYIAKGVVAKRTRIVDIPIEITLFGEREESGRVSEGSELTSGEPVRRRHAKSRMNPPLNSSQDDTETLMLSKHTPMRRQLGRS